MAKEGKLWNQKVESCPKCGSYLLSDGEVVWCTFVGGGDRRACDYGIRRRITQAEHLEGKEPTFDDRV